MRTSSSSPWAPVSGPASSWAAGCTAAGGEWQGSPGIPGWCPTGGCAVAGTAAAGSNATAITGTHITEAAREGDPAALRCFSIVGTWLGQGLANLAAILDPGCIVVGGGVSEAGELLLGPARAAFDKALPGTGYRPRVEILRAALGADAGIVGAADLVQEA